MLLEERTLRVGWKRILFGAVGERGTQASIEVDADAGVGAGEGPEPVEQAVVEGSGEVCDEDPEAMGRRRSWRGVGCGLGGQQDEREEREEGENGEGKEEEEEGDGRLHGFGSCTEQPVKHKITIDGF